ncbi:uncharacterized protein LOC134207431 [Armigeres subalbatus]|uniref:uncharacterized protein LOC134207431 n=1 Tax=Armigeres subalbatus TaxID=124917 RepID=UPI002ED0CB93
MVESVSRELLKRYGAVPCTISWKASTRAGAPQLASTRAGFPPEAGCPLAPPASHWLPPPAPTRAGSPELHQPWLSPQSSLPPAHHQSLPPELGFSPAGCLTSFPCRLPPAGSHQAPTRAGFPPAGSHQRLGSHQPPTRAGLPPAGSTTGSQSWLPPELGLPTSCLEASPPAGSHHSWSFHQKLPTSPAGFPPESSAPPEAWSSHQKPKALTRRWLPTRARVPHQKLKPTRLAPPEPTGSHHAHQLPLKLPLPAGMPHHWLGVSTRSLAHLPPAHQPSSHQGASHQLGSPPAPTHCLTSRFPPAPSSGSQPSHHSWLPPPAPTSRLPPELAPTAWLPLPPTSFPGFHQAAPPAGSHQLGSPVSTRGRSHQLEESPLTAARLPPELLPPGVKLPLAAQGLTSRLTGLPPGGRLPELPEVKLSPELAPGSTSSHCRLPLPPAGSHWLPPAPTGSHCTSHWLPPPGSHQPAPPAWLTRFHQLPPEAGSPAEAHCSVHCRLRLSPEAGCSPPEALPAASHQSWLPPEAGFPPVLLLKALPPEALTSLSPRAGKLSQEAESSSPELASSQKLLSQKLAPRS